MPQTLGPYELRGELGKGAMAVVWRAFDPNLEREVAIKEPVIPPGTDSATAAELGARFVREGKAAAKLNHPGVVTIYASDIYDGRPAIVMELIEGETLSDILDKGPLEPQSAIAVADQLLDAAGYAHSRGIVHRDIKPDNVFITDDGRVKLADFGIAHTGQTSTLTQAGTVMGTPGYMAPEQVTGSPVDARADIFAIGVILFEMLTGQNPFGATDGMAATTVMYRIVHEQVPEVSDDLLAGLPADVSAVLAAALAKDPDARFGSATAFRTALRGGPIEIGVPASTGVAQPASPVAGFAPAAGGPAVSSAGKSNWTPYIIVGAVGVLVIGALLVFAGGGTPSSGSVPIEPAAEQEEEPAVEEAASEEPPEPEGPTVADSRQLLLSSYNVIDEYGREGSGRIGQLATRFNQDPLDTTGATASTTQAAEDLIYEIDRTAEEVASYDLHSSLEGCQSTQLRLLELCRIRADAILQACYISQTGGDIKPVLDEGRAAKNEYVSLYPQGQP